MLPYCDAVAILHCICHCLFAWVSSFLSGFITFLVIRRICSLYFNIYIYICIIIIPFEKPLQKIVICSTSQNLSTRCFNTSLYVTNCGDLKTMFCSHWGMNRPDFKNFFLFSLLLYFLFYGSSITYFCGSSIFRLNKIRTLTAWFYHGSFTGFGYPIFYISSEAILKSLVIS